MFHRFLAGIQRRRQRSIDLRDKKTSLEIFHLDLLQQTSFSKWKSLYYVMFLQRLKEKNHLLRCVPEETITSMRSSFDAFSSDSLAQRVSLPSLGPSLSSKVEKRLTSSQSSSSEAMELPLPASTADPISVSASQTRLSSSTTRSHFPLLVKSFLLWQSLTRNNKRLSRIEQWIREKHDRGLKRRILAIFQNGLIATLLKKHQRTVKARQDSSQSIPR